MPGVVSSNTKTCAVLQPGYLPWLGYFEQVHRADVFVHLDDVQFDKHGWRNRNRIKGPSGPQWLTVPVRISGHDKPRINDVRIDPTKTNWAAKHLKTLKLNYGACPFFDWLYQDLRDVLTASWTHVAELDIALVDLLCKKLGLHREFRRSSEMTLPDYTEWGEAVGRAWQASLLVPDGTLRMSGRARPTLPVGPSARLIAICRQLGCNHYYTGAASRAYMDLSLFEAAGISVTFQDYKHPTYSQRYGDFESHLSVIDLMFHCGPDSMAVISPEPQAKACGSGGKGANHVYRRHHHAGTVR